MQTSVDPLGTRATAAEQQPARKTELGQEDFLRLLTAQLNAQDPLDPLDNKDFVAQMAEFTQVSSLADISQSTGDMAARLADGRVAAAGTYLGRTVLVPGGSATPDTAGVVRGAIDLSEPTSALSLRIRDADGRIVETLDLGAQPAGLTGFEWTAPDPGRGPFRLEAYAGSRAVDTAVEGRVRSVGFDSLGATTLSVDGVGTVSTALVRAISQ